MGTARAEAPVELSASVVFTGTSTRCSSWRAASVSASQHRRVPCGLIFGGQGSPGCHRGNLPGDLQLPDDPNLTAPAAVEPAFGFQLLS